MKSLLLSLSIHAAMICGAGACAAAEPPQFLLWSAGAPGALGEEDVDKPNLWLYPAPADKATGAAVVICPGGGYAHLAVGHEGSEVAEWFNERGVSAFVLRYRLAPKYHHPTQVGDVQRAMRLVRSRAKEWNIDPVRIGIMGFSAGGHLASTAATHFDDGDPNAADPIDRSSCRPDFAILAYPVITFGDDFTHSGSRDNLLGKDPAPELIESLSNQTQVTARTPPTFLFHTGDDTVVPAENSVLFYQALRRAKVPAELHIYESGKHGVGLARSNVELSNWPDRLALWLERRGVLTKKD